MKTLFLVLVLFLPVQAHAANSATNFGGVGIDGVPQADGRIVVRQLVMGGPAQAAGIKSGDVITHIDGKPTLHGDFQHLVERRLRGVAGTSVALTVVRPGEKKPLHFTVTRRQLKAPAAAAPVR